MSDPKSTPKDVIYIDVDDEITGIIDKVRGSGHKIVALVLPKRAAVLQSVVNMKLLKRSADGAKKHIVLITSEAGLLPLAGSVGVHVAKTLQSKPEIPDGPASADDKPTDADEDDDTGEVEDLTDEPVDKAKTVGELAGAAVVADEVEDTIELDDEADMDEDTEGSDGKDKDTGPAKGKNKKLKVPNFNKFRLVLILAVVGVFLLSGLGYAAVAVMPKATVVVKTDSSTIDAILPVYLKTGEGVVIDVASGIVPAQSEQVQKTLSEQVAATGSRNDGEKAEGNITLSLTDCSKDQVTIPAGTGLTSAGKTFITDSSATLQSVKVGNSCKNSSFPDFSSKTVSVTAQSAGATFNIAAGNFSVKGYSNVSASSSAAMTGGTDVLVKIVSQTDVDAATQKIGTEDSATIQGELESTLTTKGLLPIKATFNATAPSTKLSANVGDVAENVTVTQEVVYSLLGAKESDLEKLVANNVATDIDPKKQSILDHGLDDGTYTVQEAKPDGMLLELRTTVVAGPELNIPDIKKQIAGKKAGQAQEIIKQNPGVTDVTVSFSPFWVGSIPSKTDKITITVEKPAAPAKADTDSSNATDE